MAGESLAERIDGRGADIAEHDPDSADRQLDERALPVPMTIAMRRIGGRQRLGAAGCSHAHPVMVPRIRIPCHPCPAWQRRRSAPVAPAANCRKSPVLGGQAPKAGL